MGTNSSANVPATNYDVWRPLPDGIADDFKQIYHSAGVGIMTSPGGFFPQVADTLDINAPIIVRPVFSAGSFPGITPLGTAATTVDISSAISVNQIQAGATRTIPTPTDTTTGRILRIYNIGNQTFAVPGHNETSDIRPGTHADFIWDSQIVATTGWYNSNAPRTAGSPGNPAVTLPDFAADAVIGTAPLTVDNYVTVIIQQVTSGITVTIPNPTPGVDIVGKVVRIVNDGGTTDLKVNTLIPGIPTVTIARSTHAEWTYTPSGWFPDVGALSSNVALKKFRTTQTLAVGANTITHNLNLSPTSTIFEVRTSTGTLIVTGSVTSETANTVTFSSTVVVPNARITVIG